MPHASVYAALADAAALHPDRAALTYLRSADPSGPTETWSHSRFLFDVRRTANLFRRLAGDREPRVAMLLPAIPQAYLTLWGGETAGVVCPINYLLAGEHVAELLRASEANILVALGPNVELDIWSRVEQLRAHCPSLRAVLAVGGAPGADDFDASLAGCPGDHLEFHRDITRDTLAALFHTGGTTGAPKLAQHTHGNQLHASRGAALMYGTVPEDTMVNGFPLFHVAGSFVFGLSTLMSGGHVFLPTLLGMRNTAFVPRYWEAVERFGATLLAAVPTVISTLLAIPPGSARIETVRALLTGGSPLPPELASAFEHRLKVPVRNILGMTECGGVISVEPVAGPRVAGSCGLRLPYTQVAAFAGEPGEGKAPCAPGVPGVLHVRGPNVGPGYTDASRNRGTFVGGGWLATGDIGHVDSEGRIFITGRAKDVIIRGGHNIEPEVIESALMRHPDVAFAAAVGEPDEYAGEVPVAFVVLKEGSALDGPRLVEFAREYIPERPACPKRIDILSSLPLTAVGKVYKPALRLRAIERAINERLLRAGLSGRTRAVGKDSTSGLAVEFMCEAAPDPELDRYVSALMSPFAIAWEWRPAG
jgi:fatty-acyl-CoA synthase